MKKGFTLIELLAVIVILAIIALIAVPTITGLVEKARKGSVEQSANGYIDAVDKQIALNLMDSDDTNNIDEGIYDYPMNGYNIKVKGQTPKKGWVEVTKNGVDRYSLVIGDYVVTFDGDEKTVIKGTEPASKPGYSYLYSNDLGSVSFAGYSISGNVDLGNKYTALTYTNITIPFDTMEECQYSSYTRPETCALNNYTTQSVMYEHEPGSEWNVYLRYSIDNQKNVKKIDTCFKYNGNEYCLDKSNYNESKNLLKSIYDGPNNYSSSYGDGEEFYWSFENYRAYLSTNGYFRLTDGNNECDITDTFSYCTTFESSCGEFEC